MEHGMKKEHLAMLAVPLVPLQIILPWVISKYTAGPRPLDVFIKAYPWRLLFGAVFAGLVYWTKQVKRSDGSFPMYYFVVITLAYGLHQITVYSIYVALMAFHAKTSDPAIGGTYMTLLNTVTNLGGNWPATVSLYFVDYFTVKTCTCHDSMTYKECETLGGACILAIDGYYVEIILCFIIGFVWFAWGYFRVHKIQEFPASAWKFVRDAPA
jgi:PAT family acetyl-CoA transporter-like MFS transporter 1